MSNTLVESLTEAHLARARTADTDLRHVIAAPALFKPETVTTLVVERSVAMSWASYFAGQAAGR